MPDIQSSPSNITFDQLLEALLNVDQPLPARYLYRLSDLIPVEVAQLKKAWPQIPAWRRQALMEDVEELGERDTLLSYEELGLLAVTDPEPQVRLHAVRTLWESDQPKLIPLFLDLLVNDSDTEVRAAAATGLGRFVYAGELDEIPADTYHQVGDQLLATLTGSDPDLVRRRALEALSFSSRPEVDIQIEKAYRSGSRDWLVSAVFAMGRSANERWQPVVQELLDHDLTTIRVEAARAAGELEISTAVPRLLELLQDSDQDVRWASIWSLSQIGGEGVGEALEAMLEEAEEDEEIDFIENALENLAFNEDLQLIPMFDLHEGEVADGFEDDLPDLEDDLFEALDDDDQA